MAGGGANRPTHRLRVGEFQALKIGAKGVDARDPYHMALTIGWPAFIAALMIIYAVLTAAFAVIYWLIPGPIADQDLGTFRNALFFSFQVLSTSDYSGMNPDAVLAKVVATVEIVLGLAFIAIMMGLVFVRFSRPKARLVFADRMVVAMHNGKPTLMVRVGNGRAHAMTDTNASLNVLVKEQTLEGNEHYNVYDLPLTRPYTPYFPLIMTLMHVVDEQSALFSMDGDAAQAKGLVVFLSFETRDPQLADTVNALRTYGAGQIAFGARYVDAISSSEAGPPVADLDKISLIEPDRAWAATAGKRAPPGKRRAAA